MKERMHLNEDQIDHLSISLRAYTQSATARSRRHLRHSWATPKADAIPKPSSWTLVFDTETTTDPGQALRLGTWQVREDGELRDTGIFYERKNVTARDFKTIKDYAKAHDLRVISRDEFIDKVFYRYGYELRATTVGLNLVFDISRVAIGHASARGTMRGGFSFRLTDDKRRPAAQAKHLSQKASLIRFAAPFRQHTSRSARKRGSKAKVRRGFFVDIRTFAAALFAKSFSLQSLAEFLGVEHRKLTMEDHGGPITFDYLDYALRDTQTTWECYEELVRRYQILDLKDTPPPQIYSEASIGKAYLKAMGVKSWREVQGDVPSLLAKIMGSYYGGRSEVRVRRELREVVLCDFLSMYPTDCTLMRLWEFVVADGMRWRNGTKEARRFLNSVTLADLQRPDSWRLLRTLVRIQPDWDILPVRAQYAEDSQATIGANYLKADQPLWVTLADCIGSKLLTGATPKIVEALIFEPGKPQSGLCPVAIAANREYLVDPITDDFYKRLIELRNEIKARRDKTIGSAREALEAEQNAIKIAANATSYGIFVEVNVKERAERSKVTVHSSVDRPYIVEATKGETPGRFFHPLLATLITGAARLMLAIAERLVADNNLGMGILRHRQHCDCKTHNHGRS